MDSFGATLNLNCEFLVLGYNHLCNPCPIFKDPSLSINGCPKEDQAKRDFQSTMVTLSGQHTAAAVQWVRPRVLQEHRRASLTYGSNPNQSKTKIAEIYTSMAPGEHLPSARKRNIP